MEQPVCTLDKGAAKVSGAQLLARTPGSVKPSQQSSRAGEVRHDAPAERLKSRFDVGRRCAPVLSRHMVEQIVREPLSRGRQRPVPACEHKELSPDNGVDQTPALQPVRANQAAGVRQTDGHSQPGSNQGECGGHEAHFTGGVERCVAQGVTQIQSQLLGELARQDDHWKAQRIVSINAFPFVQGMVWSEHHYERCLEKKLCFDVG